eukprot:TRINITY_DN7943_c3_g2_i1.p1 TRINITY_DN7943_c3_g2~~TRINITY_DN7943_c3_g2_i1.p1  ORF type:complete len:504 (+),score=41.40 TRINITY_DN7943_c3_g2_i1:100-1512(+)
MAPSFSKFLRHRVLPVTTLLGIGYASPKILFLLLLLGIATAVYVGRLLYRVYKNGTQWQNPENPEKENWEKCVLAKYFPTIKGRIGWTSLGDFPTKVIEGTITLETGETRKIQVKREDLNSEKYGGNKVRSLEYLLGSTQHMKGEELTVLGGTGSNQIVATAVHSGRTVRSVYMSEEAPDRDNALNILSVLSFPTTLTLPYAGMSHRFDFISKLKNSLNTNEPVFFPGGAQPVGVLGNASAALELADQIKCNSAKPITDIFLPWGSGCTSAGICLGIALSRFLNMGVWSDGNIPVIRPVFIHDKGAAVEKRAGIMSYFLKRLVRDATDILISLGCVDDSVKTDALEIASNIKATLYYGERYGNPKYGGHSAHSKNGKKIMETMVPEPSPPLWMCGCFTAKASAVMVDFLESNPSRDVLFWQTKSAVQPVRENGEGEGEWDRLERQHASIKNYVSENIKDKDEYKKVVSKL